MDMEEMQPDQNSLDFKIPEGFSDAGGGMQRRLQLSQRLVTIPASNTNADSKVTPVEKNIIAMLPESSELFDGAGTTLIDIDRVNETEDMGDTDVLRVKQELAEVKRNATPLKSR